jgi:hypothetical protein
MITQEQLQQISRLVNSRMMSEAVVGQLRACGSAPTLAVSVVGPLFRGWSSHRKTAILLRALGNEGERQPASFDLSSGVGGWRWSDKVKNLKEVRPTLRSWEAGLSD